MTTPSYIPYISVDCVMIGFDGESLKVLLVERRDKHDPENLNVRKLPGRLVEENERLDSAAESVLFELTGISNAYLHQFKTFDEPERAKDKNDILWLEQVVKLKIGRLITVAYMSLGRITEALNNMSDKYQAKWFDVNDVPKLAFDHNNIIKETLIEIQRRVKENPSVVFELLPTKFTAAELRKLYETIFDKKFDLRNFHKKLVSMPFVIALDEKQSNVAHRAARYYKFDKKSFNRIHGS